MKLLKISLLGLVINFSIARELNYKEKSVFFNYQDAKFVRAYLLKKIDIDKLSLSDYLSFKVLEKSCSLVERKVRQIKRKNQSYKDQSNALSKLVNICDSSVVSLTKLLIKQGNF